MKRPSGCQGRNMSELYHGKGNVFESGVAKNEKPKTRKYENRETSKSLLSFAFSIRILGFSRSGFGFRSKRPQRLGRVACGCLLLRRRFASRFFSGTEVFSIEHSFCDVGIPDIIRIER